MENPWSLLDPGKSYVLDSDLNQVLSFNAKPNLPAVRRLQLHLLPEPYIGRKDAPVVLLNLNPGFTEEDVKFTEDEYAKSVWRKNALHADLDYPFYPLDPRLEWTPTARWWNNALRKIIPEVGREAIARNLLCVEFFPYHSKDDPKFPGTVPSQEYSFWLVQEAIARGATILIARSFRAWYAKVPGLRNQRSVYESENYNQVLISSGYYPAGYDEVLRRLHEV